MEHQEKLIKTVNAELEEWLYTGVRDKHAAAHLLLGVRPPMQEV